MSNRINGLFELCKQQPFDVDEIKIYIKENQLSSEEVTRATLKLCDYGMFSYSDYLYQNEKEPQPHELSTYNWELLFNILIDNGLDPDLVVCDDGINHENVLQSVQFFDDGDLAPRILRNILSKRGTPNVMIDYTLFFEEVDSDFIMDIQMGLYPHKWQVDKAFSIWLVLIGFGGVMKEGKLPVKMCDNYSPDIFQAFEKFTYAITYKQNDFDLQIIDKETNIVVATV